MASLENVGVARVTWFGCVMRRKTLKMPDPGEKKQKADWLGWSVSLPILGLSRFLAIIGQHNQPRTRVPCASSHRYQVTSRHNAMKYVAQEPKLRLTHMHSLKNRIHSPPPPGPHNWYASNQPKTPHTSKTEAWIKKGNGMRTPANRKENGACSSAQVTRLLCDITWRWKIPSEVGIISTTATRPTPMISQSHALRLPTGLDPERTTDANAMFPHTRTPAHKYSHIPARPH